jgi:hypothetical protein
MQAFLKTEKGRKNGSKKIKIREINFNFLVNIIPFIYPPLLSVME